MRDFGELRLPPGLIARAADERLEYGHVLLDTAALLIEAGADMHRLDRVLDEQLELHALSTADEACH